MMDINNMQRALSTVTIPYSSGTGYGGFTTPVQSGPLPRVTLWVMIRVPEQDDQVAAVYGPDWASYVFVDPVFTLVLRGPSRPEGSRRCPAILRPGLLGYRETEDGGPSDAELNGRWTG